MLNKHCYCHEVLCVGIRNITNDRNTFTVCGDQAVPTFTLPLALFWSPPTSGKNIWPLGAKCYFFTRQLLLSAIWSCAVARRALMLETAS